MDLPPNLPPSIKPDASIVASCVSASAKHFKIHPKVIMAIISVEGGRLGTMSKNSNDTYDMGIMQINTIHLPEIKRTFPAIGWREMAYKPCINIGIGSWILKKRINEAGSLWKGVGNYHSKTPKYRSAYLKKIYIAYKKLLSSNT
jgi:soluble lytic murein transglycosylase-like protein